MAAKPQDQCYRTFDGVRWPNLCDVHSDFERKVVAEYRAKGARIRMRKHPSGFQIAFIHPDDFKRLTTVASAPA